MYIRRIKFSENLFALCLDTKKGFLRNSKISKLPHLIFTFKHFFFQYWHDPVHFDQYLEKSQFIADINNERPLKNETYKENLLKLENLVLVKNSDVSVCIALSYLIRKAYSMARPVV